MRLQVQASSHATTRAEEAAAAKVAESEAAVANLRHTAQEMEGQRDDARRSAAAAADAQQAAAAREAEAWQAKREADSARAAAESATAVEAQRAGAAEHARDAAEKLRDELSATVAALKGEAEARASELSAAQEASEEQRRAAVAAQAASDAAVERADRTQTTLDAERTFCSELRKDRDDATAEKEAEMALKTRAERSAAKAEGERDAVRAELKEARARADAAERDNADLRARLKEQKDKACTAAAAAEETAQAARAAAGTPADDRAAGSPRGRAGGAPMPSFGGKGEKGSRAPPVVMPRPREPSPGRSPNGGDETGSAKRRLVAAEGGAASAAVPIIALTGFPNKEEKSAMHRSITRLKGQVASAKPTDRTISSSVTHVLINAAESRTVKCTAALLQGKWVVTKGWIAASESKQRWVPEAPYGYRCTHHGVRGRAVYLSPEWEVTEEDRKHKRIAKVKNERHEHVTCLVEAGGGRFTTDPTEADIVIHWEEERAIAGQWGKEGRVLLDWDGFINWIFPSAWRPQPQPSTQAP